MDVTPNLGLQTRGPLSWTDGDDHALWDCDTNMEKIDAAYASLLQAITLPGGSAGIVLLDCGTF
jgi:hypothetical protein